MTSLGQEVQYFLRNCRPEQGKATLSSRYVLVSSAGDIMDKAVQGGPPAGKVQSSHLPVTPR